MRLLDIEVEDSAEIMINRLRLELEEEKLQRYEGFPGPPPTSLPNSCQESSQCLNNDDDSGSMRERECLNAKVSELQSEAEKMIRKIKFLTVEEQVGGSRHG